jgi:chromate reductase
MALRAAQKLAPEGMKIEIADFCGLPGFSEDDEQTPPQKVAELKKQIVAADAILFVTPEYNYSVPGVLKNAIDWCSRPYGKSAWNGKPAAIMGASISKIGTARAQYHLRQSFVFLNMPAVIQPEVMIIEAQNQFGPDGDLRNDDTKKLIRQLLDALVVLTNRMAPEKTRAR